jgi:hypothetical protein
VSQHIPTQRTGDWTCEECDEPLEYAEESQKTPRGEWASLYRCLNLDCERDEVLLI